MLIDLFLCPQVDLPQGPEIHCLDDDTSTLMKFCMSVNVWESTVWSTDSDS